MAANYNLKTDDPVKSESRTEYCCVPMCNGNARTDSSLSFHTFPSMVRDEGLRKRWILAIRRDEGPSFKIGAKTYVCSRHFLKDHFRWTPNRRCLKTGVVPSVFAWTKEKEFRKPPTFRPPLCEKHVSSKENVPSTCQPPSASCMLSSPSDLNKSEATLDQHSDCKLAITALQNSLAEEEKLHQEKDERIAELMSKLQIHTFGITRFTHDNEMVEIYTGFPTYQLFVDFFDCIKVSAASMRSAYNQSSNEPSSRGRHRSMELVDELFMFLCRLRCGLSTEDLAVRFNIHRSSVSRKLITWLNFLYFFFGSVNIWPSRHSIDIQQPKDFCTLYPQTRVIIDCTEIFSEKPSSLVLSSKTFSSYKSHNTWKGLVGIAPHGAVTFVSSLYSGCMSDIEITRLSGLLNLLEPGDEIMADKGFVLNKMLEGTGISITTPHFLSSDGQFTTDQVNDNQKIASLRIHIERHIRRVKEYKLLQSTVPLSIAGSLNQWWTVANLLTLFRRPLIKQKS